MDEHQNPQHYLFAHRMLPLLTYRQAGPFFQALATAQGLAMLGRLWHTAVPTESGEFLVPPKDAGPPPGMALSAEQIGAQPWFLVTLPPPQSTAEAYFVALRPPTPREAMEGDAEDSLRLYTLEKAIDFSAASGSAGSAPATMLCAWGANGSHLNFGIGPAPTKAAFLDALQALLARKSAPS